MAGEHKKESITQKRENSKMLDRKTVNERKTEQRNKERK